MLIYVIRPGSERFEGIKKIRFPATLVLYVYDLPGGSRQVVTVQLLIGGQRLKGRSRIKPANNKKTSKFSTDQGCRSAFIFADPNPAQCGSGPRWKNLL